MVKLLGVPFNFLTLGTPLAVLSLWPPLPFAGRVKSGAMLALASLLAFSTIFPVAMYAGAITDRPYADGVLTWLVAGLLRRSTMPPKACLRRHPDRYLQYGLHSDLHGDRVPDRNTFQGERLAAFCVRFMLAALITLIVFCFFPAQGTVAGGLPVPEGYETILSELSRLRAAPTFLLEGMPAGLITFPSFHVVWAVLLTAAFHKTPIFKLALVINTLMIVSTMTIGMHYVCDVLAGLLVSAVVIAAVPVRETSAIAVQSEPRWLEVWPRGSQPATSSGTDYQVDFIVHSAGQLISPVRISDTGKISSSAVLAR